MKTVQMQYLTSPSCFSKPHHEGNALIECISCIIIACIKCTADRYRPQINTTAAKQPDGNDFDTHCNQLATYW